VYQIIQIMEKVNQCVLVLSCGQVNPFPSVHLRYNDLIFPLFGRYSLTYELLCGFVV